MSKLTCHFSWEQIEACVSAITLRYSTVKPTKFTGVFGPPRGGLILAVMLSHRLKIPMLLAPTDGCLIVDDICDTGAAMQKYHDTKTLHNYTIATICKKPQSTVDPDYHTYNIDNDVWAVFPWEYDE